MKLVFTVLAILCGGTSEIVETGTKEAALARTAEAVQREPADDDAVTWLNRGISFIVLERFAESQADGKVSLTKAAEALDRALEGAPDAYNALLLRSYTAVRQSDFATGIAAGQKLALRPEAFSEDFDVLKSIYAASGELNGYRVFIAEARRSAFILLVEKEAWGVAMQDRRFGDAVAIATNVLASAEAASDTAVAFDWLGLRIIANEARGDHDAVAADRTQQETFGLFPVAGCMRAVTAWDLMPRFMEAAIRDGRMIPRLDLQTRYTWF